MRVIIRFSLNRDNGSRMRNKLKPVLERHGIEWTGARTGTYEGEGLDETEIQAAMNEFWAKLHTLGSVHLDHFWMYTDKDD